MAVQLKMFFFFTIVDKLLQAENIFLEIEENLNNATHDSSVNIPNVQQDYYKRVKLLKNINFLLYHYRQPTVSSPPQSIFKGLANKNRIHQLTIS